MRTMPKTLCPWQPRSPALSTKNTRGSIELVLELITPLFGGEPKPANLTEITPFGVPEFGASFAFGGGLWSVTRNPPRLRTVRMPCGEA